MSRDYLFNGIEKILNGKPNTFYDFYKWIFHKGPQNRDFKINFLTWSKLQVL